MATALSDKERTLMDAYWQAANYLSVGQIYLYDNPLLKQTNGFSHQDPGFIDHVINKKAEVVRVYLPPDANCLLSVTDHRLRSCNYVNLVVAGKQPAPQWLNDGRGAQALRGWARYLGVGQQRPRRRARCGDGLLRRRADFGDSGRSRPAASAYARAKGAGHQCHQSDEAATLQRAPARPVGPRIRCAVHWGQTNHLRLPRLPVVNPPTDLPAHGCVLNDLGRFHLVSDVIDRVPKLGARAAYAKQAIRDQLIEHKRFIARYGDEMPEITGWRWGQEAASVGVRSTEADNVRSSRRRV
jgi:xylulose-5-phosphate/fructose-6-phosphate phosphoketolase